MHENTDVDILRFGLAANAIGSLGTGALLALAPDTVGGWLGVDASLVLRLFGLALLGHFALLVYAARHPRPESLGKLNLVAIAPYPVIMIALVATGVIDRDLGQGLALADGALVAFFALVQGVGLRKLRAMPEALPA